MLALPVGGVGEKVLPARNRRDDDEIPEDVRGALALIWLEQVDGAVAVRVEADEAA